MRKFLWPPDDVGVFNFVRGQDTLSPSHALPFGAHQLMQNCALDQQGAISKRLGYASYGDTAEQGMFELVRNDGTKHLLKVSAGKVYKHPSTQIIIHLAIPYGVTATNGTSGAVGPALTPATAYSYSIVAVDATGKTLGSHTLSVAEVTTGATAYPITITGYGVYGAATYEIYRKTGAGSYFRAVSGLTHTTTNAETKVTWVDDGTSGDATLIPSANTTEYTLPTSQLVDFISVRKGGDNVALLANGAGLVWCDGTNAGLIQPATATGGGDPITDNRLFDVTNAVWTVRGLHYHHRYVFGADAPSLPMAFLWTDVDDYAYWPQNARINCPDPKGGRTLDFVTKDDALIVGLTTSIYALWGKVFATDGPDANIYFSRISDVGVASEWSMLNGPGGIVVYQGTDKQPHYISAISTVKENVTEGRLVEQIAPTVKAWSDHANCFATYDGDYYYLFFPSDKKVLKVRFFADQLQLRAPLVDEMQHGMDYVLRLAAGTMLGADSDGNMWELYKSSTYTDNSIAIVQWVLSGDLGCGKDEFIKRFRKAFIRHQAGDADSTTVNVYVDHEVSDSATLATTGDGEYNTGDYDTDIYQRTGIRVAEIDVKKRGRFARVEFYNNSTTERPTIYGFRLEYVPKRRPDGED